MSRPIETRPDGTDDVYREGYDVQDRNTLVEVGNPAYGAPGQDGEICLRESPRIGPSRDDYIIGPATELLGTGGRFSS